MNDFGRFDHYTMIRDENEARLRWGCMACGAPFSTTEIHTAWKEAGCPIW